MSICFPRVMLFFLSFLSLIDVIYIKISTAHSLTALKWNLLERWAEGKFADKVYFLFILFFFYIAIQFEVRTDQLLITLTEKSPNLATAFPQETITFSPVPVKAIFFKTDHIMFLTDLPFLKYVGGVFEKASLAWALLFYRYDEYH